MSPYNSNASSRVSLPAQSDILGIKKTKLTIEVLKFSYTNITSSKHEKLSNI
jgi:hypothetical protein